MKNLVNWSVLVGLLSVLVACGGNDEERPTPPEVEAAIAERIAPTGEVALAGEVSSVPAAGAETGAPRSGEEIYNAKCLICHASGTAGAPILGNADDWSARLDKGLEAMYTNAIQGLNGMPAKGLCMDCSDDELKASVDYMLEKSQ